MIRRATHPATNSGSIEWDAQSPKAKLSRRTSEKLLMIGFIFLVTFISVFSTSEVSFFLKPSTISQEARPTNEEHTIMVSPFDAYGPGAEHRTCKKTIIVTRKSGEKLKWTDQPFEEFEVDDIASISPATIDDDMLCLQVGPTVGAVVMSTRSASDSGSDKRILGSNATGNALEKLETSMVDETNDLTFEIVDRKTILMSWMYSLPTPEGKAHRRKDSNTGNFVWEFGATRMINPYTTKINDWDERKSWNDVLVMARANDLHLTTQHYNPNWFEDNLYGTGNWTQFVKDFDKPTIMLGIGIQAELVDFEETKSVKLFEHQVNFLNEISKRNTARKKSIAVRGEFTEAACINAGVQNCISLGCPR